MTTKVPAFSDASRVARRPRRSLPPRKGPGRPARPWLRPRILVPHPLDPSRLAASVPQEQAAAWCGRSRQTVARWAASGVVPDLACARLLALYAHGCPPIPPEAAPAASRWAGFRFAPDRTRPGAPWALYTPCSGDALLWTAVDDAGASRRRFARLADELERWRARALAAEAEAARWRDLVACAA